MTVSRLSALSVGVCALIAAAGVHAQTAVVPGSGDIQRSLTPLPAPTAPSDAPGTVRTPEAQTPSTADNGRRIPVRSLRITGVSVLGEDEVRGELASLVGGEWTLTELRRAVAKVTRLYQERGYVVARAILPAQEMVDGELHVQVVEGRIGQVATTNASRISDEAVNRLLGELPVGEVVDGRDLESRLLILGDTPGASRATVTMAPGAALGETDLQVNVEPGPAVHGQLDLDNHGNRYTGYARAIAQLAWNSPTGLGDQLQLRALITEESTTYARLGYRVPVGTRGTYVGAAVSQVNYKLKREYEPLDASGQARVSTLEGGATLWRAPGQGLLGRLSWDHKQFSDRIAVLDPHYVDKHSDVLSATFNGFGTRGHIQHAWTGVLSRGKLHLPTQQQIDDDAGSTRGYFTKLVLTGNGTYTFTPNWSLYASLYGQLASRNLDGSEKLSISGVTGVRAYPEGEAQGDEGVIGSAEVRYTPSLQPLQFGFFVDSGHVRYDRKRAPATDTNSRTLSGMGLSAVWAPTADIGLKAMYATRLGDEKVQSEPWDRRHRIWLQGMVRF